MQAEQPPLPENTQDDRDTTPPAMCAVVVALLHQNRHLLPRVADIETRLTQHAGTSSKPPPSDLPGVPLLLMRDIRVKSETRGGQPGHTRVPPITLHVTEHRLRAMVPLLY